MRMRWRRLDVPGSDDCTLTALPDGWRLDGCAEFVHDSGPARLQYTVECDHAWATTRGAVWGALGAQARRLTVQRAASGAWRVNDAPAPALRSLVDLDLGFTPATNLFPLRRLGLGIGDAADVAAAWLDDTEWCLARLAQRYERRDATTYWYAAPTVGYAGLLRVTADGFIREYPGLWVAVD